MKAIRLLSWHISRAPYTCSVMPFLNSQITPHHHKELLQSQRPREKKKVWMVRLSTVAIIFAADTEGAIQWGYPTDLKQKRKTTGSKANVTAHTHGHTSGSEEEEKPQEVSWWSSEEGTHCLNFFPLPLCPTVCFSQQEGKKDDWMTPPIPIQTWQLHWSHLYFPHTQTHTH